MVKHGKIKAFAIIIVFLLLFSSCQDEKYFPSKSGQCNIEQQGVLVHEMKPYLKDFARRTFDAYKPTVHFKDIKQTCAYFNGKDKQVFSLPALIEWGVPQSRSTRYYVIGTAKVINTSSYRNTDYEFIFEPTSSPAKV